MMGPVSGLERVFGAESRKNSQRLTVSGGEHRSQPTTSCCLARGDYFEGFYGGTAWAEANSVDRANRHVVAADWQVADRVPLRPGAINLGSTTGTRPRVYAVPPSHLVAGDIARPMPEVSSL